MTRPAPTDVGWQAALEDFVMSIPHGPIDLALAALLSLLLATLALGSVIA